MEWQVSRPEIDTQLSRRATERLRAVPAFHFPIAFPEVFLRSNPGFDVIVGNPPWEKAKVEEDHFWTRYFPGFVAMSKKDQASAKRAYLKERPDLSALLKQEIEEAELMREILIKSPYPGMGTGDPDVYKAACWRFWTLVRGTGGRVSVVVPRSVFSAKGSAEFRKEVFQHASIEDLTFLLNRAGWAFDDMEHRYTIGLLSFRRGTPLSPAVVPMRGPFATRKQFDVGVRKRSATFEVADVFTWTDSAALPLLPSSESVGVFSQLRKSPRLLSDGDWSVRFYSELHASGDRELFSFVADQPEGYWPVYKGESFDIWNPDTSSLYAWADPEPVIQALQQSRLAMHEGLLVAPDLNLSRGEEVEKAPDGAVYSGCELK